VEYTLTDILEEHDSPIFRDEEYTKQMMSNKQATRHIIDTDDGSSVFFQSIGEFLPDSLPSQSVSQSVSQSSKLLLALASTVILSSESCGTHDHILLSAGPPTVPVFSCAYSLL
jgi:hypothetical protein